MQLSHKFNFPPWAPNYPVLWAREVLAGGAALVPHRQQTEGEF